MISIAMTTYNGSLYVEKQIYSLIKQTIKFDELIIVDDQSTDNTINIIQKIIKDNPSYNIKLYINEANLGYKHNFKKALSLCCGDYIFLCDQDDIWFEDKLATMKTILEEDENIKLVASSFDLIDQNDGMIAFNANPKKSNNNIIDQKIPDGQLFQITLQTLLKKNFSQGCTMAIKKIVVDKYLKNSETNLPHDWELAIIAACFDGCYFYNCPLIHYRIHTNNTIGLDNILADKKMQTRMQRIQDRDKILEAEAYSGIVASKYKRNDYIDLFNEYMKFRINMIKQRKFLKLINKCIFGKYRKMANINAIAGDCCTILLYSLHKTNK